MLANYHTHTWRCNHASGTEEEYVQNAIARGMHTLGFSDHSPYCFPEGYYSHFRMKPDLLEDYSRAVLSLKEAYRQQIGIHLGVELEYYPAYFSDTLKMLRDHGVEYAILGQHFIGNEINESYSGGATAEEARLARYCRQSMEAMETGLFSYMAHPDLLRFTGDEHIYRMHMSQLCRKANECGLPLEINLLGLKEGRHYPNRLFWQIAAEEGCKAIIGCDAHKAEALLDTVVEQQALQLAAEYGIPVVETVELRRL